MNAARKGTRAAGGTGGSRKSESPSKGGAPKHSPARDISPKTPPAKHAPAKSTSTKHTPAKSTSTKTPPTKQTSTRSATVESSSGESVASRERGGRPTKRGESSSGSARRTQGGPPSSAEQVAPGTTTGPRRAGASPGPLRGRREQGRKALEKRQDAEPRKRADEPRGTKPRSAEPRGTKPRDAKPRDAKPPERKTPPRASSGRQSTVEPRPRTPADKTTARSSTASPAATPPADEAPRRVPAQLTGYLAPPGLEAEVLREVGPCWHQHGRLILCAGPPRPSVWAQDVWLAPQHRVITSIGDAASALRAVQRNWVPFAEVQHRRLALIAEKLPPIKTRTWPFPSALPDAAMGAYTLLSHERLLFSATRSSPFPHGEVEFDEDHEGPPSRAYRKLWEVFTLLQQQPQPGERCIDMGASPGGWTWVLAKLGADVTSVDKAPLAPAIAALPNVHSRVGSAFALHAEHYTREPFDWFFSDVICYPARLLAMVQQWIAADAAKRFVCTIKFQGETDHETIAAFAAIPGSRLLHLAHNRHELTWVKL